MYLYTVVMFIIYNCYYTFTLSIFFAYLILFFYWYHISSFAVVTPAPKHLFLIHVYLVNKVWFWKVSSSTINCNQNLQTWIHKHSSQTSECQVIFITYRSLVRIFWTIKQIHKILCTAGIFAKRTHIIIS